MMMDDYESVQVKSLPHTCCSHCFIPFTTCESNEDPSFSSSFSQVAAWTQALSIIFKLNYLKAFDTDDDEELLTLCPTCSELLSNLYQLYNDFVAVGKINCYLSRKLDRMDKIMDCHQQRRINCDFVGQPKHDLEDCCGPGSLMDDDDNDHSMSPSSTSYNIDTESNSTFGNNNSNIRPPTPKACTTITFDREPRIILMRLPANYSKLPNGSSTSVHIAAADDERTNLNDEDEDYERLSVQSDEEYGPGLTVDTIQKSPSRQLRSRKQKTAVGMSKMSLPKKKKVEEPSTTTIPKSKRKHTKRNGKYIKTEKRNKNRRPTSSKERRKAKDKGDNDKKSRKVERNNYKKITLKIRSCEILPKNLNYFAKRLHHPNPCWYCKRADFLSPAEVFEHTKKEHLPICDDGSFVQVCERCSRITFSQGDRRLHMKRCALIPSGECLPRTVPCDKCSKVFGSKAALNHHMLSHSTDRRFPCDECSFRGKTALAVALHKEHIHALDTPGTRVKCLECGKFYKNIFSLQGHQYNKHTIEGNQKYKESLKYYQSRKKEKRRQLASQRSPVCADCGVDFFSPLAYMNHRRTFHGEIQGKFVCDKCGRDYPTAQNLKLHETAHTDEKPFLCQECGRGYKTAKNLNNHYITTHTIEGRLKYNERTRERNRRKKLLDKQLAERLRQAETQTTFIEEDMQFAVE